MMFVSCLLTDLEVLHFFNGSDNQFIDQLALVLTSGLTWIPLYLTLFYIIVRNNETMAQIGLAVMVALVCVALSEGITDGVVKPLVERWRPNNDPILKYTIQVVGNLRGSGYSFFSAHAANTMSIAMFFSLLMRGKRLAIALFSWSLLNCWTRLYLGMHYPSDILCGLLVGAVIGLRPRRYRQDTLHPGFHSGLCLLAGDSHGWRSVTLKFNHNGYKTYKNYRLQLPPS